MAKSAKTTTGKRTQLALSSRVRLAKPGDKIFSLGSVIGETRQTALHGSTASPSQAPADPMRPAIDALEKHAQELATGPDKNTPSKEASPTPTWRATMPTQTGAPNKPMTDEEALARVEARRARHGLRPLPLDHPLYQQGWLIGETVPSKRPIRGSQKTDTAASPSQAPADPMRPAIDALEQHAQELATGPRKNTPSK